LTPPNLPHSEQYLPFNPLLSLPDPSHGGVRGGQGLGRSNEETNNYDIKLFLLLSYTVGANLIVKNFPDHPFKGIGIGTHAIIGGMNAIHHSIHGHIDLFGRQVKEVLNPLFFKLIEGCF